MNKKGKKITSILLYYYWWHCATYLFYTVDIVVFFGTVSQITAVLITAVEQTHRVVGLREFNTVEKNNNPLIIIQLIICVPYKSETSVGLYYCYTHVLILRVTDETEI